nr:hypothetical protein Ycf2 [Takakia lepidozioides]
MEQELSEKKYLYKGLEFEGIEKTKYFSDLWAKWNLVRLLTRIFSNRENLIKFFDFRILGSLISRDLRSSKINRSSILNGFMLLILPVFIHRLNNRNVIEEKQLDLVEIVNGHINYCGCDKKIPDKSLKSFKRNLSISTHHSPSPGNGKSNLLNLRRNEKNCSIIKQNLRKELCVMPVYEQIHLWGSRWWKIWILEKFLPSWNLSQSSTNKIDLFLGEKNVEDLKYFFEFYIENIIRKDFDWEYKFDSIFPDDSKGEMEFKSEELINLLEDILFLRIMSAFCEKIIFEIEGPFEPEDLELRRRINNNNNNEHFFDISSSHEKKMNWESNWSKRKMFQFFNNWGESDQIIGKSFISMKKRGWLFLQNYAEFYIWQLYRNSFVYWEKDLQPLKIVRNLLNARSFWLNFSNNEQLFTEVDDILSDILYNFSKHISNKVKRSKNLRQFQDKSINNFHLISQKLKYIEKKERYSNFQRTSTSNSIETNFLESKKKISKWFLREERKKMNTKRVKQLTTNSIFRDLFFFIRNGERYIESSLSSKSFSINSSVFWVKETFTGDIGRIIDKFFPEERRIKVSNFPRSIRYAFLDILSMDELDMGSYATKKYIEIFKVAKKRQHLVFFGYSTKSDSNRLVYLWEIKKKKNSLLNPVIFSDSAYNRIERNICDIEKSSSNIFRNSNPSCNAYSFWPTFYPYDRKYVFHFRDYAKLVKFLDQLNWLMTNSDLVYNKTFDFNIINNDQIQKIYALKKNNLFFNRRINKKNGTNDKILFILLDTNTTGKNQPFLHQIKKNFLIRNYSKEIFEIYILFTKCRIGFINWYRSNRDKFYRHLNDPLNELRLINKFIFHLTRRNPKIRIENESFIGIRRDTINESLLSWRKSGRIFFRYEKKREKYINWSFDVCKWTAQTEEWKELSKYSISGHRYLAVLSNKIDFFTNRNSVGWSKKLNRKNNSMSHRNYRIIISENFIENFRKFSNLLDFCQKFSIIKDPFLKRFVSNKIISSKEIKYDIDRKIMARICFDEIPITKFITDYFYNRNNNQICVELFDNTFFSMMGQNLESWLNSVKVSNSNRNSLKSYFHKADTLKFFNYLQNPHLEYNKRLPFYMGKISIKNPNLTYGQLLNTLPICNKLLFSSINRIRFSHGKPKIISIIESQVSDVSLPKYLRGTSNQSFLFVHEFYKLFNSLIPIIPSFHGKEKGYFIHNISIINRSTMKRIVNFEITDYCQSYLEILDLQEKKKNPYIEEVSKPNHNFIQINFSKNDLLSENFLIIRNENNEMLGWVNQLFGNSDPEEDSTYVIANKSISDIDKNLGFSKKKEIQLPLLPIHSTTSVQKPKIYEKYITSSFSIKSNLFRKYTSWFFTSEWWKYLKNIVLELFSEIIPNLSDQIDYTLHTTPQDIRKNLYNSWTNLPLNIKTNISGNSSVKWNSRLSKQIGNQREKKGFGFRWSHLGLINTWIGQYLATIGLFAFGYLTFEKYLSTLLGSDYIGLWRYFETIRYLTDPSRGIYLDKMIRGNSTKLIEAENLLKHFIRNLTHYMKNGEFYLFTKRKLNRWLVRNKSLDLSRRERKLLVQSLVTERNIGQYGLDPTSSCNSFNYSFGYQITKQQGLHYLRHLSENYQKNLVNYPFHKINLAEKWVFLAFWQKITSSQVLWQAGISKLTFHRRPVPLQSRLSSLKGILLIGPPETGRSYLIKNIAADSFVPLIKVSIDKLLYNKPDIITESWMNILMESLRRLSLILELAEKMSPCIIWIQNIHELNVNRLTQNVESDPTFLLGILLKYFQTDFVSNEARSLVVIGSTHLPEEVDPALISPNRLDRLLNIRMLNILQRQREFPILLRSKNLYLENEASCLSEFGYGTLGFNARDLAAFVNEISLIGVTQNQAVIQTNTIRLAFHRQASGFTYTDNEMGFGQNFGILFYKVGKAVIQNILIKNYHRNPLYIGNDLWRKKKYYLSKCYLESSIFEPAIKEFTILPHVLGCLAGSAARDSWFISGDKPDNWISLDRYAEDDSHLAYGILESLLVEFPWLEISRRNNIDKKKELTLQFQTRNPLHMIQKGFFSIANKKCIHTQKESLPNKFVSERTTHYKEKLYHLTSNTAWAPRISRLSFIRSNLFDWIKRSNEFEVAYNYRLSKGKERRNSNGLQEDFQFCRIVQHKTKEQLPYERILSRIRRRNVQELESQLEEILLEEQFVILGFYRLSKEYRMEYQLSNKPMLFIGGRFLWDPTSSLSQIRQFVFSRQELFVDEEMLRRLYVTYGARREREKSRSSQKMKQFFLRRGYGRDSMTNLSVSWWNQLPFVEKHHIETFKRIEGIGVQLKRPQVFTPVYLYQRWLIENPKEKLTRFELLGNQQRWFKANSSLFHDSFIYSTLLESYRYLFKFFLSNRILLNRMTKILLKKGWLFQNEFEHLIYDMVTK